MKNKCVWTALLAVLAANATLSRASVVSLGNIGVAAGIGSAPEFNLLFLQNNTDSPCTSAATYLAPCSQLTIQNWSAQITYTNSTTGVHTITHGGADILPGNDYFGAPLDGSLRYSDSASSISCCINIINKVVFTASIPSSFQVYDPSTTLMSTFFAQTPFTFTYIPSADYQSGNSTGDLTALLVPNGQTSVTPEPALNMLIGAGLMILLVARGYVLRARTR